MTTVTAAELATRVRHATGQREATTALMRDTLEHWRQRGIAEEHLGTWKLTPAGLAMFAAYAGELQPTDHRRAA